MNNQPLRDATNYDEIKKKCEHLFPVGMRKIKIIYSHCFQIKSSEISKKQQHLI